MLTRSKSFITISHSYNLQGLYLTNSVTIPSYFQTPSLHISDAPLYLPASHFQQEFESFMFV